MTSNYSPTAVSYARALLELANEQGGQAEAVAQDLRDIRQIVDTDASFGEFLANPSVSAGDRGGVLEKAFKGRVSPLLFDFLRVLNAKNRLKELSHVAGAYDDLLDEQLGKVEVDVTVAQALGDEQLARVQQRVSQALGRDAVVHQYVDEQIIGGMVLRVQDKLIDASVRYQLQAMKEQLLSARAG